MRGDRQLQHAQPLTFAQTGNQHDLPVGKLQAHRDACSDCPCRFVGTERLSARAFRSGTDQNVQEQPTGGVRQNARENGQTKPRPFGVTRGAGSCPNLASVLQESWKNANIHAGSEVFRCAPICAAPRQLPLALCGGMFFIGSWRRHRGAERTDETEQGTGHGHGRPHAAHPIRRPGRVRRALAPDIVCCARGSDIVRCARVAARGRCRDRHPLHARPQDRRTGGALLPRHRQGLLQGRRARREHRCRDRRPARSHRPAGNGCLRDGRRRHQLSHQVPRWQSRHADQGAVHRV